MTRCKLIKNERNLNRVVLSYYHRDFIKKCQCDISKSYRIEIKSQSYIDLLIKRNKSIHIKTHKQYMIQYKSAVGLTIHPTLSVQKVYVMPLLSTLIIGHTRCNTKRKIKSMLVEETLK